jgi:hypothetical protein
MKKSIKNKKLYEKYMFGVEKELNAALKDAVVYGSGLIKISRDGDIKRISTEEAEKLMEFINIHKAKK